ncbi:glycerol-1-phosphate dehydrogenase [NAD(P)+] [Alicyclobacillus hesperidum]|uniref:Glycerol-1-phosphate dehydrogenase [NAD(P)+] n=1 Tax=Alicyclobacillus hesperidum TaxID=89784 RepID=A0A1H2Y2H1_9BACL|nr:sn-glycerol-1-phosphate dehydrogenase [Alicyclobacillus hesperidum]SDW99155.1 glycerol-1-phosphate dehydrogenase [NAD(P)+] [Alicyclobacillus hesperidum]
MDWTIEELNHLAAECSCGLTHHPIEIREIVVEPDALRRAAAFVKSSFQHVCIFADANTFRAAGQELANRLKELAVTLSVCIMEPDVNGDVVADERTLVQGFLACSPQTEAILAVGAGTVHDIARFCSFKMRIPFISIPTAASVDGFTSAGAPLIVRGVKQTFQTQAPIAVFSDVNVLVQAPRRLAASGFGDMIGKFTSLADWNFGHLVADEPYCPWIATLTAKALETCVDHVHEIQAGGPEGISILMRALILSGLAMLLFGQSYPASGGEHHLSHDWEMELLRTGKPQVLHGLKVGAASVVIAETYKKNVLAVMQSLEGRSGQEGYAERVEAVSHLLAGLPSADDIRAWIRLAGGVEEPAELGIDAALVAASLTRAHRLRNRYTMLRFLNEPMSFHKENA